MANKKTLTAAEQAKRDAEKTAKFVELAEKRVTKALAAINNVGRLANPQQYKFDSAKANAVMTALTTANIEVEKRFEAALQGKRTGASGGFKF